MVESPEIRTYIILVLEMLSELRLSDDNDLPFSAHLLHFLSKICCTGLSAYFSTENHTSDYSFCHDKKLGKESLRLVILAESERRLLFDSETVLPVNTPDIPAKTPLSNCGRFRVNYGFLSE